MIRNALRRALVQALILLRNRGMFGAEPLLRLCFRLFRCRDKALRDPKRRANADCGGLNAPQWLEGVEKLEAIRAAFNGWLRDRALRDLLRFGHRHEERLGVEVAGYRLSEAKSRWGSLGRDRVVRVHWRLVQAPAAAMEYVVAHEVAHLIHRNHSPEFWQTLGRTLPDWAERKLMLERWEQDHRAV